MRVTVIPARELTDGLCAAWCDLQELSPALRGPCLRPELPAALGQFHDTVFVAVIEEQQKVRAFLPFLKVGAVAKPVPMCDYQAIIAAPDVSWDMRRILREAGLKAWDFTHLVGSPSVAATATSAKRGKAPRADLGDGIDAYLLDLENTGRTVKKTLTQRRLLHRDVGPLRFEADCNAALVLSKILMWKSQRFNEGRPLKPFVPRVLDRLVCDKRPEFSGLLSALYAGDSLIAAHFGLRCHRVLHYWFPAFDPAYAKYSPGRVLLYELLSHLPALDCQILDFGPGGEEYKQHFKNTELPIAEGTVEIASVRNIARKCRRRLRVLHSTPGVRAVLKPVVRGVRALMPKTHAVACRAQHTKQDDQAPFAQVERSPAHAAPFTGHLSTFSGNDQARVAARN